MQIIFKQQENKNKMKENSKQSWMFFSYDDQQMLRRILQSRELQSNTFIQLSKLPLLNEFQGMPRIQDKTIKMYFKKMKESYLQGDDKKFFEQSYVGK